MKYLALWLVLIPTTIVYFGLLFACVRVFLDGLKDIKYGLDLDVLGSGLLIMFLLGLGLSVVSKF